MAVSGALLIRLPIPSCQHRKSRVANWTHHTELAVSQLRKYPTLPLMASSSWKQVFAGKDEVALKNSLRDLYLKESVTVVSKCMEPPTCTATFLTEHPKLYEAVLGKSMPPKCRLNMSRVLEIEASYTCRTESADSTGCVGCSCLLCSSCLSECRLPL